MLNIICISIRAWSIDILRLITCLVPEHFWLACCSQSGLSEEAQKPAVINITVDPSDGSESV
jgi:hypothetical protein